MDARLKRRVRLNIEERNKQFETCLNLPVNGTFEFDTENANSWRTSWRMLDKGGKEFETRLAGKTLLVWRIA